MDIAKAFEAALRRKREKRWEKIYVVVDIHDTILYACYQNEETYDYMPYAKPALQLLSSRDDICLILWSGCYLERLEVYRQRFAQDGIHFDYLNENPEVGNTDFQNFDKKLYFNVGIDDKFGFDPETDWVRVIEAIAQTMTIRLERPADYRAVENLTRESFWNVYRPGCTEHYVLHCYRTNPDFIPELDLVMEEDGRIIGHVMFSKAELVLPDGTRKPSWTFGPISIDPDYKRKGYGLQLLNYALDKARNLGVGFLCMEGNIDFYKHAGFGLASRLGIHYHAEPADAEVPYFLAQELIPGWLAANGITEATYCPPKGYFVADENPEAFESYEATFPPKEKLRLPGQLGYEEEN